MFQQIHSLQEIQGKIFYMETEEVGILKVLAFTNGLKKEDPDYQQWILDDNAPKQKHRTCVCLVRVEGSNSTLQHFEMVEIKSKECMYYIANMREALKKAALLQKKMQKLEKKVKQLENTLEASYGNESNQEPTFISNDVEEMHEIQ